MRRSHVIAFALGLMLIFLALVTSFFALFMAAYGMRMSPHLPQGAVLRDWRPLAEPPVLWLNTLWLLLGSAGMQVARGAARRGRLERARAGLLAGGVFAFAFLAGQWLAWRQLLTAGFYAAGNPAYAFFYVLTAVHGLHLAGGLVVWARTFIRLPRGAAAPSAWSLQKMLRRPRLAACGSVPRRNLQEPSATRVRGRSLRQ